MPKYSETWRRRFLEELAGHANVRAAAEAAGISAQTAYNHARQDRRFARRWERALVAAGPALSGTGRGPAVHRRKVVEVRSGFDTSDESDA